MGRKVELKDIEEVEINDSRSKRLIWMIVERKQGTKKESRKRIQTAARRRQTPAVNDNVGNVVNWLEIVSLTFIPSLRKRQMSA